MLVDYEKAWADLKAVIAEKGSHGQRDLLTEMGRIEVEQRVEEGLPEKALRLYGAALSDGLLRPALSDPALDLADGSDDQPPRRGGDHRPTDTHALNGST